MATWEDGEHGKGYLTCKVVGRVSYYHAWLDNANSNMWLDINGHEAT